ncbi:LytR C-terminal domain-containing protein [Microbacterium sp. NPDC019599]|uniref:LytR C-terminal domain-containing protein n=1 Tax=Microbacterium sp. NPDC019599 TaxID=3154690 RepID=UPI0033E50D7B
MPKSTYPRDRFDDLPVESGRVGAHRAENPHMRGWVVFLWAVLATIVLVTIGIFATLIASGRIELNPKPVATPTPVETVAGVVDTSYSVLVLNATPEEGLATQMKDQIVAAGWPVDSVTASGAGVTDFAETTVYYAFPEDEAAARGLAETVLGGAQVAQSDVYQPTDDPATADVDESTTKQLVVVIGLDRTSNPPSPSASPTP